MTPILPSDAIRIALDNGELDAAIKLIAQHETEVRVAVGHDPIGPDDQEGWQTLLTAQRSLLEQLQSARGDALEALQRLQDNRRGAQAYQAHIQQ